jgi:cell fate regulator YaaT (PSP1 superfamily)
MPTSLLVRYGVMAEVARFDAARDDVFDPGTPVVVRTQRGEELGHVVGPAVSQSGSDAASEGGPSLLRAATESDREAAATRRAECEVEFPAWQARIHDWGIDLELIDLERTLDGAKLVLYVLNDRGPETTKLALRAAAAGLGVIEVQPVGPEGLIQAASGGGGCGNCSRHK